MIILIHILLIQHLFSEMNMIMQLVVLKESLLHPINKRLSSANLQQPYFIDHIKTFSVEQGHSESLIDISLRDNYFDRAQVILMKNSSSLGRLPDSFTSLRTHGLQHCFLDCGSQVSFYIHYFAFFSIFALFKHGVIDVRKPSS